MVHPRARSVPAFALLLLVLAAVAPLAEAGNGRCGVTLVFKNPDLQLQEDGYVHASGWFFIQFQAVGEGAETVDHLIYEFGAKLPQDSMERCDTAVAVTGAYFPRYRGDWDASDGFFVPINTTRVPDGVYHSALIAMDKNEQELGRFWAQAVVENGKGDVVKPWPIVLPGDGVASEPGVTVEFAEKVQDVHLFVNGVEVPLADWTPPARDDDVVPENPVDSSAGGKRVWGPGYKWAGATTPGDVLRVTAMDLAGNTVEKVLHLSDTTTGGIIKAVDVEVEMQPTTVEAEAKPGGEARYPFRFLNLGKDDAHTSLGWQLPTGIEGAFRPDHVVIPPGGEATATLVVTALPDAAPGRYDLKASAHYKSGANEVTKETDLVLRVLSTSGRAAEPEDLEPATIEGDAAPPAKEADTPGPAPLVALGVLALAALAARRR